MYSQRWKVCQWESPCIFDKDSTKLACIKFIYSEKAKRNSKRTHLGVDRLETPLQFQIGVDLFICAILIITLEIIFEIFKINREFIKKQEHSKVHQSHF